MLTKLETNHVSDSRGSFHTNGCSFALRRFRAEEAGKRDGTIIGSTPEIHLFFRYPVDVEDLLSRAFTEPGGAEAFRRTVAADVGVNRLGIDASCEGSLRFAFPVVIFSGVRP